MPLEYSHFYEFGPYRIDTGERRYAVSPRRSSLATSKCRSRPG